MTDHKEPPYTITICDRERAEEFKGIFGTDTLPIVSPIPVLGHGARLDGEHRFYLVKLEALSDEQRASLYAHLSQKFKAVESVIRRDLESRGGLPVLAQDVLITVKAPGLLF